MPALLIKDFLQTQGLKLPVESVHIAYLAAKSVMDLGEAAIERHILWYEENGVKLSAYLQADQVHERVLKQIFMALDSVFSRSEHIRCAAVYARIQSEDSNVKLLRLCRQGEGAETLIDVRNDADKTYLAARTVQSAWMNIVQDNAYWLELGELEGERNKVSGGQMSVPVCTSEGAVLGVLQVESDKVDYFNEAVQADWAALALALSEPMRVLLDIGEETAE